MRANWRVSAAIFVDKKMLVFQNLTFLEEKKTVSTNISNKNWIKELTHWHFLN